MQKENKCCYKKSLSCRRVWRPAGLRHLPIIVSDGTVNGRESSGRPRTETLRGDNPFYMNGNGFTLIELLVVVLIIGILAAVAVPQYQKAVLKTRYATLKDLTYSLARAQEVYYLANGVYATDFEELSIDMPAGKLDTSTADRYNYDWGACVLKPQKMVFCTDSRAKMQLQVKYDHAYEEAGVRDCIAFSGDINDIRNQLCRQESGGSVKSVQTDSYIGWRYQ